MKTKDQIIESNKLIGEFMGWAFSKTGKTARLKAKDPRSSPYRITDIHYHTSWDWLMPVVEKIEGLYWRANIMGDSCTILPNDYRNKPLQFASLGETKIEATYGAILQFIKWYNTQTTQP